MALLEEVGQYIEDRYELEKVSQIYLSGDGASWNKAGARFLPNTVFVLDEFHLMKSLKKFCVGPPYQGSIFNIDSLNLCWKDRLG